VPLVDQALSVLRYAVLSFGFGVAGWGHYGGTSFPQLKQCQLLGDGKGEYWRGIPV